MKGVVTGGDDLGSSSLVDFERPKGVRFVFLADESFVSDDC